MSPEHNLYVHDKITGHFHHSSFLGGAATVAAGSIVVEQGKLLELTPHSGHYQPSEEDFARCVQTFKDAGVDQGERNKGFRGSLEPLGLFLRTSIPFIWHILSAFLPRA